MKSVKEKIRNAKELCPGMSDDFYLLTDYMADNMQDTYDVTSFIMICMCITDDLVKGRNGFANGSGFPEKLAERKEFVLAEVSWIPQLVDSIADADFAEEFRAQWKMAFGTVPPKRVNTAAVTTDETYPEYVNVAVDWWANSIISPKLDNGEPMMAFASMLSAATPQYTPDEIKTFKTALSKGIMAEIKERKSCRIDVDYHACGILAKAGDLIGVPDMIGYPVKTHMVITPSSVVVSAGYRAPDKTLWEG